MIRLRILMLAGVWQRVQGPLTFRTLSIEHLPCPAFPRFRHRARRCKSVTLILSHKGYLHCIRLVCPQTQQIDLASQRSCLISCDTLVEEYELTQCLIERCGRRPPSVPDKPYISFLITIISRLLFRCSLSVIQIPLEHYQIALLQLLQHPRSHLRQVLIRILRRPKSS